MKILSLTLFKIITVSRPTTLIRIFLMKRSRCLSKGRIGRVSLQDQNLEFSPSVGYQPHSKIESPIPLLTTDHILSRKVSLITFRKIFPKILSVACIFSYTMKIYWKKLVQTKSFNTKQCPAGLSPRIKLQISLFLPKISSPLMLLCCTYQEWGESYPTAKDFLISPSKKIPS